MIVFLGDSFTWGQGLYFENWIKTKSPEEISKFKPEYVYHETFSFQDQEYRKNQRFPHLVAKHYNTPYLVPTITNGGGNYDIYYDLKKLRLPKKIPYLFVIQLTEFTRKLSKAYSTDMDSWYVDSHQLMIDEYLKLKSNDDMKILEEKLKKEQINLFVSYINKLKQEWNSEIDFIFCNWLTNYSQYCSDDIKDKFVKFDYDGKVYDSFQKILNSDYSLANTLNIFDKHLNSKGHEFVANSIIKKIDSMNISLVQ